MKKMSREDLSVMENHLISVLMIVLVGLGGWNLISTSNLQANQRANYQDLNGKLNLANEKIGFLRDNFNTRTLDRYTGADASRDKAKLQNKIQILSIEFKVFKEMVSRHIELYEGKQVSHGP